MIYSLATSFLWLAIGFQLNPEYPHEIVSLISSAISCAICLANTKSCPLAVAHCFIMASDIFF